MAKLLAKLDWQLGDKTSIDKPSIGKTIGKTFGNKEGKKLMGEAKKKEKQNLIGEAQKTKEKNSWVHFSDRPLEPFSTILKLFYEL